MDELVDKLLDHLLKISEEAYTQELSRVEGIFDQLDEKIVELTILEDEASDDEELQEFYGKELELMENLKEKLDPTDWLKEC